MPTPTEPTAARIGYRRRFWRLYSGTLTWERFDAIIVRARRMRGWT